MKPQKSDTCELCARSIELSFHHLIPKKLHAQTKIKKMYAELDLEDYGIWICGACHKFLHGQFDHQLLADELNSKKKILQNEKFGKFVRWVRKQNKNVKMK